MGVKMKERYGMMEFVVVGCRIKIFWREQDLLILADGVRDSVKIDGRMQDEKWKITPSQTLLGELRLLPGGLGINILSGAGWWD